MPKLNQSKEGLLGLDPHMTPQSSMLYLLESSDTNKSREPDKPDIFILFLAIITMKFSRTMLFGISTMCSFTVLKIYIIMKSF